MNYGLVSLGGILPRRPPFTYIVEIEAVVNVAVVVDNRVVVEVIAGSVRVAIVSDVDVEIIV